MEFDGVCFDCSGPTYYEFCYNCRKIVHDCSAEGCELCAKKALLEAIVRRYDHHAVGLEEYETFPVDHCPGKEPGEFCDVCLKDEALWIE